MTEKQAQAKQTSGIILNWVFALAIALVAAAIAWVAFSCLDSMHKNVITVQKIHITPLHEGVGIPQIDTIESEILKHDLVCQKKRYYKAHRDALKLYGSEIAFESAIKAREQHQYAQAIVMLSRVLAAIPLESKSQTAWHIEGGTDNRALYTAYAHQYRAFCYMQMSKYPLAVADWTEAIKLRPNWAPYYQKRARTYFLQGEKVLGAADIKMAQTLTKAREEGSAKLE
jgi:tetratricopeptide (TPR) repeat protein